MKSPAYTSYRLSTYRAYDEYYSLYSLYSSEEYRDRKRGYIRECGRYERGGGDDGDGRDDEYWRYELYRRYGLEWVSMCQ